MAGNSANDFPARLYDFEPSDYGWRLSPTCTTMAQPPSFLARFGDCFSLLTGSRRSAGSRSGGSLGRWWNGGADRAGAGEVVYSHTEVCFYGKYFLVYAYYKKL